MDASFSLKVDVNKDRVVSLEEFLKSTEKRDFNSPKEWEVKGPEVAGFNRGRTRLTLETLLLSGDSGHEAGLHGGGAAALRGGAPG